MSLQGAPGSPCIIGASQGPSEVPGRQYACQSLLATADPLPPKRNVFHIMPLLFLSQLPWNANEWHETSPRHCTVACFTQSTALVQVLLSR